MVTVPMVVLGTGGIERESTRIENLALDGKAGSILWELLPDVSSEVATEQGICNF